MKFSIVTPTFNSGRFLSETIQSVISQKGDFTIEYIIVDNSSHDNTTNIVEGYQQMLAANKFMIGCNGVEIQYSSGKDGGMYEAINRGFSRATGDIYAWINSDDIYLPGAFNIIARSFKKYPDMRWIKGITSYINEFSTIYEVGRCLMYSQDWLEKGVYGKDAYFVQQDSVFWHANLWKMSSGIDPRFRRAGDYALWIKFSQYAALYTVKAYVSCFRKVEGQISQDLDSYIKEFDLIPVTNRYRFLRIKIRLFFLLKDKLHSLLSQKLLYRLLFGSKKLPLIDTNNGDDPVLKMVSFYVAQ